MIEPNKLSPFRRFCVTIGAIPTSYMESMTYYEMLEWLCKYLQDTVIPAVNTNASAVEELQGLFVELKNYVDTYFDNLDIQSEVDHKLDEMVESGQLAELVAQLLDLGTIIGFDTVADMAAGENFVTGSKVRTMGSVTYNDGAGAYYRIRELQVSDVVDGVNIIALTNFPTLIAELLPDDTRTEVANLDTAVTNINTSITNINTNISKLNYNFIPHEVKGYAHRGLSNVAPENTKASIYKAGYAGCDGVEVDIQCTSDNEIILMHDTTVDRTTNGTGTVNQLTSTYIAGLSIDSGNYVGYYPTQTVPTLQEALEICAKFGMTPVLELKGDWTAENANKLAYILNLYNMSERAIIISFLANPLRAVRAVLPYTKMMLLYGNALSDEMVAIAEELGNCGFSLNYSNNLTIPEARRQYLIQHNIPFGFYTMDGIADIQNQLSRNPGTDHITGNNGFGRIKNGCKRMIGICTADGIIPWAANNATGNNCYDYDFFTFSTEAGDNKLFRITYDIPIYNHIGHNAGVPMVEVTGTKGCKYYIWTASQNINQFNFRIVRVSDNAMMTYADFYSDVGASYVNIISPY